MNSPLVVVTGANGFVGSHVAAALSQRGARVRAVVRRPGAAPAMRAVVEHVGDFSDPAFAAEAVEGADALITTVYPMGDDQDSQDSQRTVAIDGTVVIAEAAQSAGAQWHVHISTAAVYDRSPGRGDVDEQADLVDDQAGDYSVVKRDVDAALSRLSGMTRVLLRPPAILGPGATSVWNRMRPQKIARSESARHAVAGGTFAWVHVEDLAAIAADVALGHIATSDDAELGPVAGSCTPLNVACGPATQRDYYGVVTRALAVEPVWDDELGWTGQIRADRARRWGWQPQVTLEQALAELEAGLGDLVIRQ